MSLTLVLGVMAGIAFIGWAWIGQRLNLNQGDNPQTNLRRAARAFDEGDLDLAVELTQQIWNTYPDQISALVLLVRSLIYRSYEDYDRAVDRQLALQITSDAIQRYPYHLDVMAVHAFALQANDQAIEAAEYARRVLAQKPDHLLANVSLALAYGRVGGYENAFRQIQIAVSLPGAGLDAQRALAISLNDLGRYDDALQAVDLALTENGRLLTLYFERGLYAMQTGDAGAATASYFSVLAFDPDNVKARLRMCELSILLRESDRALNYCHEAVQMAPTWAEAWYQLGREYFMQGNYHQAQTYLNRCSSLQLLQNIPILERNLNCWLMQGEAAEINNDCNALRTLYNQFQQMVREADLPQTWIYPPEGPCSP
ncbi:MAG: hypothetical protein Kow00117_15040 [Phototrophicales bacterium]